MLKTSLLILMLAPWVTACTSIANKSEIIKRAEAQSLQVEESAQSMMASIGTDMTRMRSENMDFFAPLHWQLASDSLDKAAALSKKNAPEPEIKKHLLVARDCIAAMQLSKSRAVQETMDVGEYFRHLQKIEAQHAFPAEYAGLITDLRKIMEKIDAPDLAAASGLKKALLKAMVAVEVKTITYQQTNLAEITLKKAKDNDADDIAEKSYEYAESVLKRARDVIAANPRNAVPIDEASYRAFIEASHAQAIAEEVKTITKALDNDDIDENALEGVVLRFESSLATIARGFGIIDLHYLTLSDQAALLAEQASALSGGHKTVIQSPNYVNRSYPPVSIAAEKLVLPPEYTLQ